MTLGFVEHSHLSSKGIREGDARVGGDTVQNGPYKGQALSVDHIVPRAVAPEQDNVIANLELGVPVAMEQKRTLRQAR